MLEVLDISQNPGIVGKIIGEVVAKCEVRELSMANCEITDDNFKDFTKGLNSFKVNFFTS